MDLYTNKKNGQIYAKISEITNATNEQDGQTMVLYFKPEQSNGWTSLDSNMKIQDMEVYAREINEFNIKFEYLNYVNLATD